jgi:hypothetical protein
LMDQDNTTWTVARTPGVMRETACTVVHQRTASLDSERGIDDGNEAHEGRRQTVRRELNSQSTGRPRLKLPAFQPDWRKSAVRNDRGDDGNGGIIRSPIRAIVLPDRAPGAELNPTPRRCAKRSSARHRAGLPSQTTRRTKGRGKPSIRRRMPGAGLSDGCNGKALSDMPAFQPYWGKPAVRKCVQEKLVCSVGGNPTKVKVRTL